MFSVTIKSSFVPADHMRAIRDAIESSRNDVPAQLIGILEHNTTNAPPASENGKVGAVDTGEFRDSWDVDHGAGGIVTLTNGAPGAAAIDGGRRAGSAMPPPEALIGWVDRHLDVAEGRQASVAFVIARAIAQRGLKPRYIVQRSLPELLAAATSAANIDLDRRYARIALTQERPV